MSSLSDSSTTSVTFFSSVKKIKRFFQELPRVSLDSLLLNEKYSVTEREANLDCRKQKMR